MWRRVFFSPPVECIHFQCYFLVKCVWYVDFSRLFHHVFLALFLTLSQSIHGIHAPPQHRTHLVTKQTLETQLLQFNFVCAFGFFRVVWIAFAFRIDEIK